MESLLDSPDDKVAWSLSYTYLMGTWPSLVPWKSLLRWIWSTCVSLLAFFLGVLQIGAAPVTVSSSVFAFSDTGKGPKGGKWPTARQKLRRAYTLRGSPGKAKSKSTLGYDPFSLSVQRSLIFIVVEIMESSSLEHSTASNVHTYNLGVYFNIFSP